MFLNMENPKVNTKFQGKVNYTFKLKTFTFLSVAHEHTANVLTRKTTGTGKSGAPAGKVCTIYGKGL